MMNHKTLKRYQDKLLKLVIKHRLEARQFKLEASLIGDTFTPEQEREANAIDNIYVQCMIQAEKYCRTPKHGAVPYAPATEIPRKKIKFWRLALQRRRGEPIGSRTYDRAKLAAQVFEPTRHMEEVDLEIKYQQ